MRNATIAATTAILVIIVAAAGLFGSGSSPTRAATVTIQVGNLYFCDVSFQEGVCDTTITAGDTVTWSNTEGFHTVTQCDASFATCPPSGGFDSGSLPSGNSFSHTFTSPGTYPYHCTFHPTDMRGRIIVQAAQTPTPTPAATATPAATGAAATATPGGSATPAAVPRTGGGAGPEGGGGDWIFALAGASLLAAAACAGVRARRA